MTHSRLVVEHMTPEQERLFREMTGIISDSRLSLIEMYDLLDKYWGIDFVTDDSVMVFQGNLLEEMRVEKMPLDEIIDAEVVAGLLGE